MASKKPIAIVGSVGPPVDDLDILVADAERLSPGARLRIGEVWGGSKAAAEVRALRASLDLTQAQLAELAGLKQGQVSRYENEDYRGQKVSMLTRIADAVGWDFVCRFRPPIDQRLTSAAREVVQIDIVSARMTIAMFTPRSTGFRSASVPIGPESSIPSSWAPMRDQWSPQVIDADFTCEEGREVSRTVSRKGTR